VDGDAALTQDDMRVVVANPSFFGCFGDRELRHMSPSVACIPPDPGVDDDDPYASLTGNQVRHATPSITDMPAD